MTALILPSHQIYICGKIHILLDSDAISGTLALVSQSPTVDHSSLAFSSDVGNNPASCHRLGCHECKSLVAISRQQWRKMYACQVVFEVSAENASLLIITMNQWCIAKNRGGHTLETRHWGEWTSWWGVAPPQSNRGSGERRELPQWGPGWSPADNAFQAYFRALGAFYSRNNALWTLNYYEVWILWGWYTAYTVYPQCTPDYNIACYCLTEL